MNAQERAQQCLKLSVQGMSLRAIGRTLGTSLDTVRRDLAQFSAGQVLAAQRRALGAAHVSALDRLNAAIARMNEDGQTTACAANPKVWDGATAKERTIAKLGCRYCPIIRECRDVGRYEKQGVWGGWAASRMSPPTPTTRQT